MSMDKEVLLKKLEKLSIEEIGEKIEMTAKEKGIDVDKLVGEAVEWARKSRQILLSVETSTYSISENSRT